MNRSSWFVYLPLCAALIALSACGTDDEPGDTGPTTCSFDIECAPLVCDQFLGICVEPTEEDVEIDTAPDVSPDVPEDTARDITRRDTRRDTAEPDVDVQPDITPDLEPLPDCINGVCCERGARNRCGGCGDLMLGERRARPGDACGECGGGFAVCNGPNTLRCDGGNEVNDCGLCGELAGEVGASCGVCGTGTYICDETAQNGFLCEGGITNGCGGCGAVAGRPGTLCRVESTNGIWACVSENEVVCSTTATNACGGTSVLLYKGSVAQPGTQCGVSFEGALLCDGTDALTCSVDDPENACGGRAPLAGTPDEACTASTICGDVAGTWTCATDAVARAEGTEAFDGVICVPDEDVVPNRCGGCDVLENRPGDACENGRYVCDGANAVACLDTALACEDNDPVNACGGCAVLGGVPGTACGDCGTGVWVCDGRDGVVCRDDHALNACGGCEALDVDGVPAEPGDACGPCGAGTLACDGFDTLLCEGGGTIDDTNLCGGCAELTNDPGDACGACDTGEYACNVDNEAVACVGDEAGAVLNACGGCTVIEEGTPGEACGECGSGVYVCNADNTDVECIGDLGEDARNECFGCAELEADPGDPCGTCGSGTFECHASGESLQCIGDQAELALNECGGCMDLDGAVGDPCGTCGDGALACGDDNESLVCEGAEIAANVCGGCGTLDGDIGGACGRCGAGEFVCNGPMGVRCADVPATNECGNCAEIDDVTLDGACGECGNGRWICFPGGIACFGDSLNECGGCGDLPEHVGDECGTGQDWTCAPGDPNDNACNTTGANLCGGTATLMWNGIAAAPGQPCGTRNEGALRCATADTLSCSASTMRPNACGGSAQLSGEPGTACTRDTVCGERTGQWTCATEELLGPYAFDGVFCSTDGPDTNVCGGCSVLDTAPGTPCEDGVQVAQCVGTDAVSCGFALGDCGGPANACGGCGALEAEPGEACGACATGRYACTSGETVACLGDQGDDAINECGGCGVLIYNAVPASPGDSCQGCGTLECSLDGARLNCDLSSCS